MHIGPAVQTHQAGSIVVHHFGGFDNSNSSWNNEFVWFLHLSHPLLDHACTAAICVAARVPICHCQICNFSNSQSKMVGPLWYCINNLQITAEQKMVMHWSECEPGLRLHYSPWDRFLWKMWLVSGVIVCVYVCVCKYCVPKGSPQ